MFDGVDYVIAYDTTPFIRESISEVFSTLRDAVILVALVVLFFLLCSSILLLTGGDLLSLAGVYTIAFLGVMTMFSLGNLILKEARSYLKRTYRAPILIGGGGDDAMV